MMMITVMDYINGVIFKYDFSQKYNTFINKCNKLKEYKRKRSRVP